VAAADAPPPSTIEILRQLVWREPTLIFGVLVAFGAALFAMWRVRFGLDLTDESFYCAIPLRFVLGDLPFRDERTSVQGSGLLLMPFVFVYHLIVRDSRGFVLFLRMFYLVFLGSIGWALTRTFRGWISRGAALASAGVVFFFAPYGIYNFSYNTMGAGFAILATLASFRLSRRGANMDLEPKVASRLVIFAGFAAAASAAVYPTLALVAPIHFILVVAFGHRHLGVLATALRFIAGGAILTGYIGVFVLRSGLSSLRLSAEFLPPASAVGSLETALTVMGSLKPDLWVALVILSVLVVATRWLSIGAIGVAALIPTLLAPAVAHDIRMTMRFYFCIAAGAPIVALMVKDRREAFRLIATVWVPLSCVGLVTGVSSGNGGVAAGLGAFGGMIVTCVLAARASEESLRRVRFLAPWGGLVAPVLVVHALVKLVLTPGGVYCDEALEKLTARIRTGAFMGIRTTPAKRDYMERLTADIKSHIGNGEFVLSLPDLPGGYLIANRRPAIPELWPQAVMKRLAVDAEIFRSRAQQTSLVIMRSCAPPDHYYNCVPSRPSEEKYPLNVALAETHTRILTGSDYALLVPVSSSHE
jgi:hypothetical protein